MTHFLSQPEISLKLTIHAHKRAAKRGITSAHIAHILKFGRKRYQNKAIYYTIGHKEISKYQKLCSALKDMNGMHLVTALDGSIITLFRNKKLKLQHC